MPVRRSTVAMRAGWRDERGDFVDQLQRGEHQITRAIGTGLWVVVDQMIGIQQVQMLQREGWTGAVAQPGCFALFRHLHCASRECRSLGAPAKKTQKKPGRTPAFCNLLQVIGAASQAATLRRRIASPANPRPRSAKLPGSGTAAGPKLITSPPFSRLVWR